MDDGRNCTHTFWKHRNSKEEWVYFWWLGYIRFINNASYNLRNSVK